MPDQMTPEEEHQALKEMHEYQAAFNTGYNIGQTLDDPATPERDKKALKTVADTLQQSQPQSEKMQIMREGMAYFEKDKEREKMRAILRSGQDKSKDQGRER